MTKTRDGFSIRELDTHKEIKFIDCTQSGRMRERVEDGLLMKVDFERFYVVDTREEE